jgi:hypothetical protein
VKPAVCDEMRNSFPDRIVRTILIIMLHFCSLHRSLTRSDPTANIVIIQRGVDAIRLSAQNVTQSRLALQSLPVSSESPSSSLA